ncbi:MAG: hypothetical protein M9894_14170 [Planctomycetes bacterium]|nr:hypothetical protein [Planctomycetota bacterium]
MPRSRSAEVGRPPGRDPAGGGAARGHAQEDVGRRRDDRHLDGREVGPARRAARARQVGGREPQAAGEERGRPGVRVGAAPLVQEARRRHAARPRQAEEVDEVERLARVEALGGARERLLERARGDLAVAQQRLEEGLRLVGAEGHEAGEVAGGRRRARGGLEEVPRGRHARGEARLDVAQQVRQVVRHRRAPGAAAGARAPGGSASGRSRAARPCAPRSP